MDGGGEGEWAGVEWGMHVVFGVDPAVMAFLVYSIS